MPLAWNEIRHRAIKFANEWKDAAREAAEKQTYWNEFFDVFGVSRKSLASFEAPVKKLTGHDGFIDLFWKGNLIVEHKSLGGDLGKAQSQAFEYIQALLNEGNENEIPRYVIVSDFARIVLYDLEPEEQLHLPLFAGHRVQVAAEFSLADFHKNIRPFAFIAGYKQQRLDPEDPANLQAARIMADLHDALKAGNYKGHELRVFLVRILFCLFAEDTGIFGQPRQFELYLTNHTAVDGSDLGPKLARLFSVLNTPEAERQRHLEADLAEFPYVNGDLFNETLNFADFNSDMRNALLGASRFRWETISPAVFGSLFQEVMQAPERRQIGAHYTAEKNIMKVVRSLFLDDLLAELEAIKTDKSTRRVARLDEFHKKLANLRFLDPACGCGNFLVITYRELRALELEVLRLKHGTQRHFTLGEISTLSLLDVDQMYGIEIEEFPARIAEVALWLVDHQANMALSIAFSEKFLRIPLRKSPHIHVGNALRIDWAEVIAQQNCSYILGNPPFVGKAFQTPQQKSDMEHVWGSGNGSGILDYVTCWYRRAAEYIQGQATIVAYVSTNSITQGEQVSAMWGNLLPRFGLKIYFAHRTFPWESEARGKAHVHVVIVGFGTRDRTGKRIFDYTEDADNPFVTEAPNISPYLVAGGDVVVMPRAAPLCDVPPIVFGSMPNDGGHLLLSAEDRKTLLEKEPEAKRFIRRFVGAVEFINATPRWCLWLVDITPDELRSLAEVKKRVEGVRKHRQGSTRETTRNLAVASNLFGEIRQPKGRYLIIPSVSSENRPYIPIDFAPPSLIASNLVLMVPGATRYNFGILTSAIHMAWTRQVCGRLKSDFRYSNKLVYNNFPWPEAVTDAQKSKVEESAQAVLDARAKFPDATLADLYDPVSMPAELTKAHHALDRAVDRCYRKEPFPNDRARVEFLFALYEKLTAPLLPAVKPKRAPRRKATE